MAPTSDCIFCQIVSGKIPSARVYEDDAVIAFKDRAPLAPLHYLFVPKVHVDTLADVPTGDLKMLDQLFTALLKVVDQEKLKEKGFRVMINNGKDAGQTVFHLHLHLISGKKLSH